MALENKPSLFKKTPSNFVGNRDVLSTRPSLLASKNISGGSTDFIGIVTERKRVRSSDPVDLPRSTYFDIDGSGESYFAEGYFDSE